LKRRELAIGILPALVKKLWRTKIVCGKGRKKTKKLRATDFADERGSKSHKKKGITL
jgi:hypothetical protein